MATAGGLDIHEQLVHAASAPSPALEPAFADTAGVSVARVADVPPIVRPKDRAAWPKIPALAFAIVILLLPGISAAALRSGPRSALALVQSAGAATSDTSTAKMAVTIKSASGELANGITVDGAFDFEHRRGLMMMDPSQFGAPGVGKIEIIFDYSSGLVMYMKFPPAMASQLGNKPWLKMDVASLMRQSGSNVDIDSLLQGQSNNPTSGLAVLQSADRVDRIGPEQVRGVDTTHYRVEVNIQKAVDDAPADLREELTQLQKMVGGGPMGADVWIDGDNHVRRFSMVLNSSALGGANPAAVLGQLTISYDLYDFGAPVATAVPPADQVTNFQDVLNGLR